jgi:hypothetical protein
MTSSVKFAVGILLIVVLCVVTIHELSRFLVIDHFVTESSALSFSNVAQLVPGAEVVIAHYAEDMSWISAEPFDALHLTCYNKGPHGFSAPPHPYLAVKKLPNVGRCDHTYLHHILDRYDSLADVTIFLPGSCTDPHKKGHTDALVRKCLLTRDSVFHGPMERDVLSDFRDFQLDDWVATNKANSARNAESKLLPCPIRPFGSWYQTNFPDVPPIKAFCFYGILAVSKEHIRQHPRERYQRMIRYLDHHSNPEAGHYMERAWGALFYPYPSGCLLNS